MKNNYKVNAVKNLTEGQNIEYKGVDYEVKSIIDDRLNGRMFECENADEVGKPKYFTERELINGKSIHID